VCCRCFRIVLGVSALGGRGDARARTPRGPTHRPGNPGLHAGSALPFLPLLNGM